MISELIYQRLLTDAPLRQLLGSTDEEARIKANATSLPTRVIIYTVVPVSYDKRIHHDRLELRIIEKDAMRLEALADRVLELLVLEESAPPITHTNTDNSRVCLYACQQNGGGQLDDETNIYRLLYFDMTWRKLKNG